MFFIVPLNMVILIVPLNMIGCICGCILDGDNIFKDLI
jgi:hypothetical protein